MIYPIDTPQNLTNLIESENLIIAICYFIISSGIAYSIWRNRLHGIDWIVVAIAGIFFSCGLGHSFHAAQLLGLTNIMLLQVIADMITVIVAIFFLSFYRSFNLLTRFSQIVDSEAKLQLQKQKLEATLSELQHTQIQLIQSEKMSSLGNLVAGIAHEMNNPLGFISATLQQAKPTIADITEHLNLYQESFPHSSEEIIAHSEEIDLEYSLEDLPKMLDAMNMACNRLKNISTSLRTFSRADQDYKVQFNIHEGIDSTILILKHRLKANENRPAIEVITEYGNIPQINCFPGQLNQVFMNIIANAIDALEESNINRSFAEIQANLNRITITTLMLDQYVQIIIADNAQGMNEAVKEKIFEHLFTTKEVGKGTGLGLAIAKQIIEEKHGGVIEVDSRLGEGTKFIIQLPL
ncbi:MAG: HAMP domain-containing histidine kinase [Nostoc sp. TH1S01]|nr:HAMP domain-containing histidine kinase [Nostoc sp. TH1S01]